MAWKGSVSNTLRRLGLLPLVDRLRFRVEAFRNRQANVQFKMEHPEVSLPPDYLIYESFRLDYRKYYYGGRETAAWLAGLMLQHCQTPEQGLRVLDWGCGPGRTIRHLGKFLPGVPELHGTDYNARSINWCQEALPQIAFNHNSLAAELPYADDSFDAIYGISIFTHLSAPMHQAWLQELHRVLKTGGVLILTMQGDNFREKLSPAELAQYNQGELVVRGNVVEGHRTYSAFHPDPFLRELFADLEILEKIVVPGDGLDYTPQDTWVLRGANKIKQAL